MAEMLPVSEEHPLHECRHFVACHKLDQPLDVGGSSLEAAYNRLGVVLLGTVMEGDCGVDAACMMLGLPQTTEKRSALRSEVSDYLCERSESPWMHDMLAACGELDQDDIQTLRSGAGPSQGSAPPPLLRQASSSADSAPPLPPRPAAVAAEPLASDALAL
ncbi:MAG: hypothetical protein GY772_31950, partial [bacterium]|nr:hypothetical protein [bacterium]